MSVCVFRQFDAVHQVVEIPNFVVNSVLRNASSLEKNPNDIRVRRRAFQTIII